MKKGFSIVLVVVVILFFISLIPITKDSTINVSASFDNTIIQVINIQNWKNWYPKIKEAYIENPSAYRVDSSKKTYTITTAGKKFIIHAITPMSYAVSEEGNNLKNDFAFNIFPGNGPDKMIIYLKTKNPLIYNILGKNNKGMHALDGLTSYLENPSLLYGFNIHISTIRDSIIASYASRIKKDDLFTRIQNAHVDLMQYIKDKHLIKTGNTSISYIPLLGDSLQVTVGIPVNRKESPEKEINCLLLPGNGRVLVGNYKGKFLSRQQIYSAMSKYLTDHTLSIPAESFERYLNDSLPASDSAEINIELNYPVY